MPADPTAAHSRGSLQALPDPDGQRAAQWQVRPHSASIPAAQRKLFVRLRDPSPRKRTPPAAERGTSCRPFPCSASSPKEVEADGHYLRRPHRIHNYPRRAPAPHRGTRHPPGAPDGGVERASTESHDRVRSPLARCIRPQAGLATTYDLARRSIGQAGSQMSARQPLLGARARHAIRLETPSRSEPPEPNAPEPRRWRR